LLAKAILEEDAMSIRLLTVTTCAALLPMTSSCKTMNQFLPDSVKSATGNVSTDKSAVAPEVAAPPVIVAQAGKSENETYIDEAVKGVNERCGSQIVVKFNDAEHEGKGSLWSATNEFFRELHAACTILQSDKPNGGGQEFIQKKVKTLTIKSGRMLKERGDEVQMTHSGTNLTFTVSPVEGGGYQNPGWEVREEFPKLWVKKVDGREINELYATKRVWDAQQEAKEEAAKFNQACGSDLVIDLDVKSWQKGGYLTGYPDHAVVSVCTDFLYSIKQACDKGDGPAVKKGLKRISCSYAGKQIDEGRLENGKNIKLQGTTFSLITDERRHYELHKQVYEYLKGPLNLKTPYDQVD
jgi:hypothetical protein